MPGPVRCARALLVGVAGWHLAVPIAALANRDALRRTILLTRPSLDPAGLSAQLTHDLTLAVAVHAPLLLLTCFLIWKLPTAHPFILRPTTASQAFGIVFSTISATPLVALQTLIPLSLTLQLGVILLLWLPQRSRDYFAAHPKARLRRELTSNV